MSAVASPRVPVHLAWRLIRRSPARSLLIALLVAIPVLAGTFALVTISTARLSPGEAATRYLGGADAIAQVTEIKRFDPNGTAIGRGPRFNGEPSTVETPAGHGHQNRAAVDLTALLPAGARATLGPENERPVRVVAGRRATDVTGVPVDLRDPVTRGTFSIVHGTAPGAGQVAVTTSLADHLGVAVGDRLTVQGMPASVTVSAVVRDPRSLGAREVVAPL
ncbi:MAG: hypothetical protein JO222_03775, partial [Frankiales bacterium]|nr:hypothetical protein [Frankiales bacterium]